jgi:hypothetical protein
MDMWPDPLALFVPSKFAIENLRAITQEIEMIGPMLHHADALVPIFSARVSAADGIAIAMRQLTLDGVGMPQSHLVEQSRGHRPEPVAGHFMLCIAVLAFGTLGQEFLPQLDKGNVLVQAWRPLGTSVEKARSREPEVRYAFSRTGTSEIASIRCRRTRPTPS